ncbi:MAG: redoxin domain-containing protein [Chloroflexi bacterium]|nr:redoxin domain-containing protein [Chloroflexota bacterium]
MSLTPTPPRGKPSPVLLLFLLMPLLGILAAVGFALANGSPAGAPPTPLPVTLADVSLVNRPAPNFELPSLDGATVRLSSYRGQVVFLNFWATWCEPCQREMPAFAAFMTSDAASYGTILTVNNAEPPDLIQTFLTDNHVSGIPVLLDAQGNVFDLYNADRLPTTYVIDAQGVVRYVHLGEMKPDDLIAYVAELACDGAWPCNSTPETEG